MFRDGFRADLQLPFPSTSEPDPDLSAYYRDFDRLFRGEFPEYFIPQDGLWEMPLWVAHLTALVRSAGLESRFCDLSRAPAQAQDCADRLCEASSPGGLVLMSPLAQNLRLALEVAASLRAAGRRIVLGGNMASLVPADAVHLLHRGQLDGSMAAKLVWLAEAPGQNSWYR